MDLSEDVEAIETLSPLRRDSYISTAKEDTKWRLIIVTGIVQGINAVQNSILGMGAWPYMKELDIEATAPFFGFSQSAAKFVHAIFALLFSLWSYKSKSVRAPMLAGRFVVMIGCVIYLGIEYIPKNRRYVMMTVYSMFSVANGACTVLRGYIVMCSSTKDRSKAFASIGLSVLLSIIVGPIIQLFFSGIAYPGYEIIPGLRFHVFSSPIWFSLFLTILTVIIICYFMDEVHPVTTEGETENEKSSAEPLISFKKIKETLKSSTENGLNWRLISVCLLVKIAFSFLTSTLSSVMSISFMVQYAWSGSSTVLLSSIMMTSFGVISCTVLLLYIFCRLGERVHQEKLVCACFVAFGLLFTATYPFEFDSEPLAPYNATGRIGCNPEEYSWCGSALAVNPYIMMVALTVILAPTLPMLGTAFETVYSRVLGTIDQSVAQGVMAVVGDVVGMITPVFMTSLFTSFGVGPLWIMMSTIFYAVAGIWLVHVQQFRKQMTDTVTD